MIQLITDHSYRAVQAVALRNELAKLPIKRNVIVCCGLEAVEEAVTTKAKSDFLVSIGDPQNYYHKFDALVLSDHEPMPQHDNIIPVTGLLNGFSPEAAAGHVGYFDELPRPCIAVLLGGHHVGGNVAPQDATAIIRKLNSFAACALVTNSKRTEVGVLEEFKAQLQMPHLAYDFNQDGQDANPYLAMLAVADAVVVTADSARMMSEACSTGKPVYLYSPEELHFSYAAMRDCLIRGKYARDFVNFDGNIAATKTLAEAKRVAELLANEL